MRSDNLSSANDKVEYCEHDLPWFICGACSWKADPRPRAMRPDGSWLSPDPVRPPDTDEEPWQVLEPLEADPSSGVWIGFLMLIAAVIVGVMIGRLSS